MTVGWRINSAVALSGNSQLFVYMYIFGDLPFLEIYLLILHPKHFFDGTDA